MQERKRRSTITSLTEGTTGTFSIEVTDFAEVLHYTFDVSQMPTEFLVKVVEAGIKARLNSVLSGIKESTELFTTAKKEIENLNSLKFAVRTTRITKFNDLVIAYALTELADTNDLTVLTQYNDKVQNMNVAERKALRLVPAIKIQLNNLENARLETVA